MNIAKLHAIANQIPDESTRRALEMILGLLGGGDVKLNSDGNLYLASTTGSISLADGKVLIGQATGKAGQKDLSGDLTINNAGAVTVDKLSATLGAATASKAVVLDAAKHIDEVNTAKLSIGATGAAVEVTATPAHINLYTARVNSLIDHLSDGLLISGELAEGTTPAKFKTSAISAFRIATVAYAKAAEDEIEFSAVQTVNDGEAASIMFGIWLVQVDAAGTVSTKAPAADQTYGSAEDAIAALPAVDASNVSLGYILVESPAGTKFTTNTTSLASVGSYVNSAVATLPAKLT